MDDDSFVYSIPDSFWDCFDAVDENPATPTSHALVDVGSTHHTSSLADLQGSAIMLNITRFLENCGDSIQIFSGRELSVTAKDLRSCVAFNQKGFAAKNLITTSFIQPLRECEICKEPSIPGILSIVDRFVDLGYLQTTGEVRDYMLFVAREVLANDKTFPEFCQTVCAITDTGDMPTPPSRSRGRGSRKPARKK
ncbi:hypothetical protein ACHAP5_005354 [Fusarium lateritium]